MSNGRFFNAHVAPNHDGAAARIHHDFGRRCSGIDCQIFKNRQKLHLVGCRGGRPHINRDCIDRARNTISQRIVDRRRKTLGCGEIGRIQIERNFGLITKGAGNFALHGGAIRDAACTRRIDRDTRTIGALCTKATDNQAALGDGVNLTVDALHGCHQQCATPQALGITHRGHRHINGLARLGERR